MEPNRRSINFFNKSIHIRELVFVRLKADYVTLTDLVSTIEP